MMAMVVTTGATRCVKLQSNHHHQKTNTQLLQVGCPSSGPTNSVKALKARETNKILQIRQNNVSSMQKKSVKPKKTKKDRKYFKQFL